jgi:uncharacterized membrane protein YoaK (UPF0700 family)
LPQPEPEELRVQQCTKAPLPRDEALYVATILAFTGGYLEAYAWIAHRVFANAQGANLVFLWVYLTTGEWGKAAHYIPPLLAFTAGVAMACWLRWAVPMRAARIGLLVEIVFLFGVAIVHNRLPAFAGTLGISVVAAFQTVSFPRVEGWTYNSAMVTSNLRQTVEGLFAAFSGDAKEKPFRRPYVFGTLCIAFGTGAAFSAVVTEMWQRYSLIIPITLLLAVALLGGQELKVATNPAPENRR